MCKGFYHKGECAHIIAAAELAGYISTTDLLRGIERPAIKGTPLQVAPIGRKAHCPSVTIEMSDVSSAAHIGTRVAIYDGDRSDIPFCGAIIDSRPLGKKKSSKEGDIYYKAEFLPQVGIAKVEYVEMTEGEMIQAHRDYCSYRKQLNNRGIHYYTSNSYSIKYTCRRFHLICSCAF